jgi:hypothetical protein
MVPCEFKALPFGLMFHANLDIMFIFLFISRDLYKCVFLRENVLVNLTSQSNYAMLGASSTRESSLLLLMVFDISHLNCHNLIL